jgi:AcrR family transcriptional regulator
MPRTAAETRERVLEVAHDLFYWQGIRATGVDRVAADAGVAPTTLYRLFSSKDDLVAAYVERADLGSREWFTEAIQRAAPDAYRQILAVFDEMLVQIQPDRCRGCAFLMTLAEYPDPGHPAHRLAVAAKSWIRDRFGELTDRLAETTPVRDPAGLADRLAIVFDGVNASAQALGVDGPARQARDLVESILANARAPGQDAPDDRATPQDGRRSRRRTGPGQRS